MTLRYFHCDACEFDSDEASLLTEYDDVYCPMCASDGKMTMLRTHPATAEEIARVTITTEGASALLCPTSPKATT